MDNILMDWASCKFSQKQILQIEGSSYVAASILWQPCAQFLLLLFNSTMLTCLLPYPSSLLKAKAELLSVSFIEAHQLHISPPF